MTTIERLENWNNGHKARSVQIEIDDGYGATCWRVHLFFEKIGDYKDIEAAECPFWEYDKDKIPPNIVFACGPDEDNDDWEPFVGLDKTINAALDCFERLKVIVPTQP